MVKLVLSLLISVSAFAQDYIAQTDSYSCGPVALYNALVYKGRPVDLNTIKELAKTHEPSMEYPYGGTLIYDFKRAAEVLNLDVQEIDKKDIKRDGTYLVKMVAPINGDLHHMYGHMIFMHDGKAYNVRYNEIESNVDWILLQAILYEEENNAPIVLELK